MEEEEEKRRQADDYLDRRYNDAMNYYLNKETRNEREELAKIDGLNRVMNAALNNDTNALREAEDGIRYEITEDRLTKALEEYNRETGLEEKNVSGERIIEAGDESKALENAIKENSIEGRGGRGQLRCRCNYQRREPARKREAQAKCNLPEW